MVKQIILLVSLFVSLVASRVVVAETFMPAFTFDLVQGDDPVWTPGMKSTFAFVRVKVFPHNSKYNSPHGKDTTTDNFRVSSSGQCTVYQAESNTSESGISRKYPLQTGSNFGFNLKNVTQPLWLECSAPLSLIRPDYPNNGTSYAGVLFIRRVTPPTGGPYLTVVNVLPFEQYLKGVVPSEMPAGWYAETLKAQAIAARTYAYHELAMNVAAQDSNIVLEQSGAQLDDTVTYQAYLGLKNAAVSTNKAVDETVGKVMIHNNKIIKAYFHADSGGHTENAENVWGAYYPYIIGKPEIYPDGSIPGTQWSYSTTLTSIQADLHAAKLIPSGAFLADLSVDSGERYSSGRAQFVNIKFTDGTVKKVSGVDFSFAVKLKSNWLTFTNRGSGSMVISGRGFGHGAGMNQWGARILVEKMKKTYDEALKFYYTGIQIVQ